MEFICTHCNQSINCFSKVVDGVFLHSKCEIAYMRSKVVAKWEASGLLDGLKGPIKSDIASLMECCK